MPILLRGRKIEEAIPGLSSILLIVTLLTPFDVGMPVTAFLISIFISLLFNLVPSLSYIVCLIIISMLFIAAISIDLGCIFAPNEAISSISL